MIKVLACPSVTDTCCVPDWVCGMMGFMCLFQQPVTAFYSSRVQMSFSTLNLWLALTTWSVLSKKWIFQMLDQLLLKKNELRVVGRKSKREHNRILNQWFTSSSLPEPTYLFLTACHASGPKDKNSGHYYHNITSECFGLSYSQVLDSTWLLLYLISLGPQKLQCPFRLDCNHRNSTFFNNCP